MRGIVADWVARRLPVADDAHRDELAQSVSNVVADRPRCERAWEVASLVGLWLRLWGRREGGDDARLALRQGVYLGGLLLAFMLSAEAWSHAGHGGHVAHGGAAESVAAVLGAVLASGAAALASGGWHPSEWPGGRPDGAWSDLPGWSLMGAAVVIAAQVSLAALRRAFAV
ncbi:MAG: hypothetical protein ACRDZ0_03510 [Acidimicrobiales bacterium]